jgi:predicted patatin/cPLA2 family phospholipase
MSNKRGLLISGGGSWGAFGGGTLARINGDYDTIVGVSTGSLLAPLIALKEWEVLKEEYTSINNDNVFDKCWYKPMPFTKRGSLNKLAIIITLMLDQKTICTSNALRNTISKFFPEKYFDELRKQNKEILVSTQNYAQIPSKIHYFNSLDIEYEEFKDWMWCSTNFPFFTTLVKKSWQSNDGDFHIGQWSDGGISDLIGIDQLMMKRFKEIDIILHKVRVIEKLEGNIINTLMENVNTNINAIRYNIEFEYFYEKIKRLNKQGTKVTVYWLPRKLSASSMVFNKEEMTAWWEEGYNTAFDVNRVEVFMPIKRSL